MNDWNIERWLDEVIDCQEPTLPRPLKRKRSALEHPDKLDNTRAKESNEPKTMTSSQNRFTPPSSIAYPAGSIWSQDADPNATPRAERSIQPNPRRRRLSRSPSKSETGSSSVTSRSTSPRKQRVTELARATPSVHFRPGEHMDIAGANRDLVNRILDASDTFDARFQDRLQAWGKTTIFGRELRTIEFVTRQQPSGWETSRAWKIDDYWKEIEEICEDVYKCIEQKRPEECWSDQVVLQIFRLASLEASVHGRGRTECINVKHVKVDPPDLLPRLPSGTIPNAKVDYAFGLVDVDGKAKQATQTLLQIYDLPSISPSTSFMLQEMPLFSYLEIKRENSGVDPLQQLGIWAAATFKKLQNFPAELKAVVTGQPAHRNIIGYEPPPIPLWAVTGAEWELYLAETSSSGDVNVWGPLLSASARTPVGTMRIINAVAEMLRWGDVHFRQQLTSLIDMQFASHGS